MTAATNAKPRYFTTEVSVEYVEVDIPTADLEDEGWVFVGKKEQGRAIPEETAVEIVRGWHDITHPDAWRNCQLDPCRSLI